MSRVSKYHVNEDYFKDINTEDKAYWLGFLAADGHITKQERSLYFNLKQADEDHIRKFKVAINSDYPIRTRSKTIGDKIFFSRRIIISNKNFVQYLIKNGIPSGAKTLIIKRPNVNSILYRHWIRGYFDGDGSLGRNTKRPNFIFGVTGTLSICTFIRDYFNKTCNLHLNHIYHRKKHPPEIFKFQVRGNNQIYKILMEMYRTSTIFLVRKRQVFNDLITLRKSYSSESNRRYNRVN